jgi:hypothetical protein
LKNEEVNVGNANPTDTYTQYEITLAPNEAYSITMDSLISGDLAQSLVWRTSNDNVKAERSELFAQKSGQTIVDICSASNGGGKDEENTYTILAQIIVNVSGEPVDAPLAESIKFRPVLVGDHHIADPNTAAELELNPNQEVQFAIEADPWYVPLELEWSSSNEDIFTVDKDTGLVKTLKKGTAYLEVTAKGYGRLKKSVKLKVGEEFYIVSYRLYDYYGGPEVIIPEDKNIFYLDTDCFKNNTEITKVVLPTTLLEISENAFEGCTSLKEVVIPAECGVVNNYAFNGCTSLRKITLLESEDAITGEKPIGAIS